METIRVGDFSGGTSEVLDPSLIAPNAAVSSYNLDPRTGVFSPINGPGEGSASPYGFLDFIEHDGGHTAINTARPTNYVRWGDYLLWNELRSYQQNYPAQAAKFDAATGARTEERDLGMAWTTETENATVALRPIRAAALTFADGQHNLTGDIAANIEAARDVPALQYQVAQIYRFRLQLKGASGVSTTNLTEGDWIIVLPIGTAATESAVLVGRPCCVVAVEAASQLEADGETYPVAVVIVSAVSPVSSTYQHPLYGQGLVRGTVFGAPGFVGYDGVYDGGALAPRYAAVAAFKRQAKTFQEIIDLSLAFCNRLDTAYSGGAQFPLATTAVAQEFVSSVGGEYFDIPGSLVQPSGVMTARFTMPLYDYTIYTPSVGLKSVLVSAQTDTTDDEAIPSPYDIVCYADRSPDSTEDGTAVLGSLPRVSAQASSGLSSGIYRYAFTRVDEWGRESAPWPYLLEDKNRPRIDATTEATASSTLGALFVGISGMPPVPAGWKLNVYRTRADGAQYFFHSKLDTATDFVDTVSDFDLSVVPMLAEQNYPPLVVPVDEEAKVFVQHPPRYLCEYRGTLFGAYKNRLMFGAPGRFFAWPPGNYVMLPSTITGILPAGDVLLVFTLTSTYRLTGNTFSTMDFRQVSGEHGCVANRTACLVDRRPMWCSLNGVATFDGVRVSVVTDGLLKDNSEQFRGATAACSYRGEYYLLLTPTRIEPTRTRKGEPVANEREPRQRYFLRIKPGAWVTHGVFTGNVTDLKHNPSDGKLYVVGGGQVRKMFEGAPLAGYWKSGRLHGGYKNLRKNGQQWFVRVTSGSVRVQIEADGEREIIDRIVTSSEPEFITFPAGVWFYDLAFAFSGSGTVTEFGFDFEPRKAQ